MRQDRIDKSLQAKSLAKSLAPTVVTSKPQCQKVPSNKVTLPYKNRFHALSVDAVVESSLDPEAFNSNNANSNTKAATKGLTGNCQHASKNDADAKLLRADSYKTYDTESLTKYDIPLRVKTKTQKYIAALPHCPSLLL